MLVALGSAAAFLLLAPFLSLRFGRLVDPADWTRLSFASVVGGGVAAEIGLVLFALPTVLRAIGAHGLVNACATMTGSLMPGGPLVGWSIAPLAVLVPVAFWLGVRRVRVANQRVAECVSSVRPVQIAGYPVIVTQVDDAVALTVGGSRPAIVVSSGMRDALTADQFDAVVRHEAAHLANRHDVYLAVLCGVDLAFGLVPFIRRSTGAVRCGLERWADDEAASFCPGGRPTVRAALLAVVFGPNPLGLAGFGAVETIAVRLFALQHPTDSSAARRRILVLGLSTVMLVATSTAAAGGASLWRVLVMSAFCELTGQN